MELLVLNTSFDAVYIIDVFESFNWTDRYNAAGDFELVVLASSSVLNSVKTDYYLYLQQSEHLMIIEDIEITTSVEDGNKVKITGRSLESILDRRIILNKTTITANSHFQNAVFKLINDAMGSSADSWRQIQNLVLNENWREPLHSMLMETGAQYTGDNLYDTIEKMCKTKKVGFKMLLNSENKFVFSLYTGVDRTATNNTVPPVIFSPYFENIGDTRYYRSVKTLKTINYVIGEDKGDGVYDSYGDKFKVTAVENTMQVKVGTGRAWFKNTWALYTTVTTITISAADSQNPRIDTIALNINKNAGTSSISRVAGQPAAQPKPPTLSKTDTLSQYPLAYITVGKGVTKITNSNISNRVGSEDCPYGAAKIRVAVTRGGNKYTGLTRREMYTDANDISSEDDDGKLIPNYPASYEKLLRQRGREKITEDENSTAETFEGEVDYKTAFAYGVDYRLGDLVEVADKYGHETPARISEILFSYDEEGFSINPTFTVPDDEEVD